MLSALFYYSAFLNLLPSPKNHPLLRGSYFYFNGVTMALNCLVSVRLDFAGSTYWYKLWFVYQVSTGFRPWFIGPEQTIVCGQIPFLGFN